LPSQNYAVYNDYQPQFLTFHYYLQHYNQYKDSNVFSSDYAGI